MKKKNPTPGRRNNAPAGDPAASALPGKGLPLPRFLLLAFLLALAFVPLSMLQFIQNRKWLILLCCLASAGLCLTSLLQKKRKESLSLFLPLFAAYLLWLGLSVLWAASGKFFLREYSKQLFVLPAVLFLLLFLPRQERAVGRVLFLLSAIGALFAVFSIDLASSRLSYGLFSLIPGFGAGNTGFESGTRLTGIFANGNISAGTLGLCLFFSFYLMDAGETPAERTLAAVFASLQATTFLLNFSLGATGFFLVGVLIYLLSAGKDRSGALLHMLAVALPTLAAVFLSFPCFEASGFRRMVPLLCAALAAAATVLLLRFPIPRLRRFLEDRSRLTNGFLLLVLLLAAAYAAAGFLLGGPVRLEAGQSLRRSAYPEAGEYLLVPEADGAFRVVVEAQNEREIVMHTSTVLYSGSGDEAAFTVPEGTRVVYCNLTASEDTELREILLDGEKDYALHLDYPLLPGFIANRLQGLLANQNAIQRTAFFRDGMKVFRDHPVLGAGLGGFECLIYGYQDFFYETKFVHNHYIQVLLDSGIVGFLLYLGLLALAFLRLLSGRRKEGPFRRLLPALSAAFCLLVLHTTMEVVMSTPIYLLYGCALLALIEVCWARPLPRPLPGLLGRAGIAALSLVYCVLIGMNMQAASRVRSSLSSPRNMFSALENACRADVFERNDWMVSYVINCAQIHAVDYYPQAEAYSDKLMDVPSNSLHQYLQQFHLSFREYDKALLAARKGAGFNRTDSGTWNTFFVNFYAALSAQPEDAEAILSCVELLHEDLVRTEAELMSTVKLDETALAVIAIAGNR